MGTRMLTIGHTFRVQDGFVDHLWSPNECCTMLQREKASWHCVCPSLIKKIRSFHEERTHERLNGPSEQEIHHS
jgi:hypothetical protein